MNGNVSVVVFTNVTTNVPSAIGRVCTRRFRGTKRRLFLHVIAIILVLITIVTVIIKAVFVRRTLEGVPVRCTGHMATKGGSTNKRSARLPLGIGTTNMVPMVFTVSFVVAPEAVTNFFRRGSIAL